jgi:hypothetical protein
VKIHSSCNNHHGLQKTGWSHSSLQDENYTSLFPFNQLFVLLQKLNPEKAQAANVHSARFKYHCSFNQERAARDSAQVQQGGKNKVLNLSLILPSLSSSFSL